MENKQIYATLSTEVGSLISSSCFLFDFDYSFPKHIVRLVFFSLADGAVSSVLHTVRQKHQIKLRFSRETLTPVFKVSTNSRVCL